MFRGCLRVGAAACGWLRRHVVTAVAALLAFVAVVAPRAALATGTPYTNTDVPAYTDVVSNIIATIAPVILLIIGAGVLVGVVWLAYKAICSIFGVRARGHH